jgi:predicted RNase H-like HicB family nuclease
MANDILHFRMQRHDDEDGVYFVVEGVEIALVTDGETMEEAIHNLREAVALYFEDEEVSEIPPLEVTFAVTEAYA